jgi:hypothetical protein
MNSNENNKELTIIEKAEQAIKNFPDQLTKNQEEIKELVEVYKKMLKSDEEDAVKNKELASEYSKYKSLFEKANEIG